MGERRSVSVISIAANTEFTTIGIAHGAMRIRLSDEADDAIGALHAIDVSPFH